MDREKLRIEEKNFMVDCIETAMLIVDNNVYQSQKHAVYAEQENRASLIVKMAVAFYQAGGD